jgi:hypothetical protein
METAMLHKIIPFLGVLLCATPLLAADQQSLPVEVKIVNVDTGKVLAPENDSTEEYTVVTLSDDNNTPIRQWRLDKDEHGYKLLNADDQHSLDVAHGSKDDGAIIITWPEKTAENGGATENGGFDNQRWVFDKFDLEDPKPIHIKSKFSGLALDVVGGNHIVQHTVDDTATSQLWKLVYAHPTQYFKLVNANTGWVLALESDSAAAGDRAVLAKSLDNKDPHSKQQQWNLEKEGDELKLVQRASKLVLVVSDASKEEDHPITLGEIASSAPGSDNQCWLWVGDAPAKDKPARLKSKSSGLVLDVDDDGNIVQRKPNDSAKSQLWLAVNAGE